MAPPLPKPVANKKAPPLLRRFNQRKPQSEPEEKKTIPGERK
jgi:hypothetical protein